MGEDMNQVEIINTTNEEIKETEEIRKLIDYAINYQNLDSLIFNVIFVDNEKIRELNREYRNIDKTTDVISFALEDYQDIHYDFRLLGDIYISIPKAEEQAKEYGHSFLREISFLTIHGFLHLLGYDHKKEQDEKIMFELQERILDSYGIKK